MNWYKKLVALLFLIAIPLAANAQILISLLFGDALNSEKVEFGIIGGLNRSYINDIEESSGLNNFNLGFYFHLTLMENSFLSTGLLVKSNVGAKGMSTYPIGNVEFDDTYSEGELTKKIHYFYLPIQWQQRFNNRWYLEGGIQLGLRNKAFDFFEIEDFGGESTYKRDVRDEYKRFDGGFVGGVGYKFQKVPKSMSAGISYYYGLSNVSKVADTTIMNASLNFYVKIPIGSSSSEPKQQ